MAVTELAKDCLNFAGDASEAAGKTDIRGTVKELFIRACHGIAFHVSEASYNKKGRAQSEYELALTDLKEAEYWFYVLCRGKAFFESDENRLERKLASLKYRIKKAYDTACEKGDRKLKRFPPAKTIFSTPRLRCRSPLMRDIDRYIELCSEVDGELSFVATGEKNDVADIIKQYTIDSCFCIITRKNNDEMIGCIRLIPDGSSSVRYKIEFALLPSFVSCGYSYELINSAFEYLSAKRGAQCMSAYIQPSFQFMEKVFYRCGFESEGSLLSYGKGGCDVKVMSKRI